MTESKSEFYWASIAGADPEPVELTVHEGRRAVLTIGCPDPFFLDEVPPTVILVPSNDVTTFVNAMARPTHPDTLQKEREAAAREYEQRYRGARHGWRGAR